MKSESGSGFFPKMLLGFLFVTLAGLGRISKMKYLCKDLFFLKSLLNNLIT